jgi:hypothetical protein
VLASGDESTAEPSPVQPCGFSEWGDLRPAAFLSRGAGFVDEFKAAVVGHLPRELFGGFEVVATINGADGFAVLVADVNQPDGDFVAIGVGVCFRAVKEYAAPVAGVAGRFGAVRGHTNSAVKDGNFGVWADALQFGRGLNRHRLAETRRDGARLLHHGDDGGTIADANDAARLTESISYRLKDEEIPKHWDKAMDKIIEVNLRRIAHSKAGKASIIGEIVETTPVN